MYIKILKYTYIYIICVFRYSEVIIIQQIGSKTFIQKITVHLKNVSYLLFPY